MKKISKKQVTASLDRMANLFQNYGKQLGIPSRVAFDFAYRCDLLSDALDKMAAEEGEEKEEEEESSEEESEEKEEKESSKKAKLSRRAALRKLDYLYSKIAAEDEEEEEESEEEEKEEKESSKKAYARRAALRELDRLHRKATRRNRRLADFDPNEIGEEDKNEEVDADEEYMEDFDGNKPHHELSEKQEKGDLGKEARRHRANRRRASRRIRR